MSTQRSKVAVNDLREGMFVADLDRPWHETPFPLQGFYIRDDEDSKALAEYCRYVYIDVKRQKSSSSYVAHTPFSPAKKAEKKPKDSESSKLSLPPLVIKAPKVYKTSVSISKEVSRATKLHRHVYDAVDNIFLAIENGAPISFKETENVAAGLVDSVIRNPDALVWLSKMGEDDAHSYQHSVNSSIWALVFGRHLGLSESRLKVLAMGVLLAQIGKVRLDQELIENEEYLEGDQLSEYRRYIDFGVEMLDDIEDLPVGVSNIVQFHQERHNGSGYPKGVTGDRIPLLAKIAGIVDYYQNLITPRDYVSGLSPLDAANVLYKARNIDFQEDLVERFIEAVGVYPTGTLVQLNNSEVGIVTGHNQERRLLPQVMVVLDEYKQPLKRSKVVDLMAYNKEHGDQQALFITESLPKGAYDINENEYLVSGAKTRWSWQHIKSTLGN